MLSFHRLACSESTTVYCTAYGKHPSEQHLLREGYYSLRHLSFGGVPLPACTIMDAMFHILPESMDELIETEYYSGYACAVCRFMVHPTVAALASRLAPV
jgi:hypothetical protein